MAVSNAQALAVAAIMIDAGKLNVVEAEEMLKAHPGVCDDIRMYFELSSTAIDQMCRVLASLVETVVSQDEAIDILQARLDAM